MDSVQLNRMLALLVPLHSPPISFRLLHSSFIFASCVKVFAYYACMPEVNGKKFVESAMYGSVCELKQKTERR